MFEKGDICVFDQPPVLGYNSVPAQLPLSRPSRGSRQAENVDRANIGTSEPSGAHRPSFGLQPYTATKTASTVGEFQNVSHKSALATDEDGQCV